MARKTPSAFTLIELLVVVAIIAVLAAMLLPGLQRARLSAKTAQCVSVQHQIGLAMAMYCDDNDGLLPPFNTEYPAGVINPWGFDRCVHHVLQSSSTWGAFSSRRGLGHLLNNGYFGDWQSFAAIWEPTYPNGQGSWPQSYEGNRYNWITYARNPYSGPGTAVVLSGYEYRGWLAGPSGLDADVAGPRIDLMGQRAAVWCRMLDWDAGGYTMVGIPYTHPNGYNVLRYDGSVRFFVDAFGAKASVYTYFQAGRDFIRNHLDK